jgi:hypothetical protein
MLLFLVAFLPLGCSPAPGHATTTYDACVTWAEMICSCPEVAEQVGGEEVAWMRDLLVLPLLLAACHGGGSGTGMDSGKDPSSDSSTSGESGTPGTESTADTSSSGVPPTLASIYPVLGDTLGSVTLTVTGTGLEASAVRIGDAACTSVVHTSATTLTCVAPARDPGFYDVVVDTPDGEATLPGAYEAWSPELIPGARVYKANAGITADPLVRDWLWDQSTRTAPWHVRDGAGLVWFADRLWLLGGWYNPTVPEWDGRYTTNEVWSSADLGRTWELELAHASTPPSSGPDARWTGRHTVGWLTHVQDGVPYLYVIGGDIYDVTSDVWRSADGVAWERVAETSPWAGRVLQMVASYGGDLYVMGGQTDIADPSTALQDVWRSSDGGVTWTQLPDAPWPSRGMVYAPVEYDGRLWVCGGGTYADTGRRTFYNDVWSFDGTTWTEVSANGAAPWLGREYHNEFVYDGELWISSGYGADHANHDDFWHTRDGVTWTELEPDRPLAPGHADGVAVTPYGVVHATGNAMDTYVYRLVGYDAAPAPPGHPRAPWVASCARRTCAPVRCSSRGRSGRAPTASGSMASARSCSANPRPNRTAGACSGWDARGRNPSGPTTSTQARR